MKDKLIWESHNILFNEHYILKHENVKNNM